MRKQSTHGNVTRNSYIFEYKQEKEENKDKLDNLIGRIINRLCRIETSKNIKVSTGYVGDNFVNQRKT
jgi:hypothetical protein